MVYFAGKFFVLASLVVSGISVPYHKRDFAQVEADIILVAEQVTTLDDHIAALPNPGATLPQAVGVHNDAQKLAVSLRAGAEHVIEVGSFDEDQGRSVLDSVEGFEPSILSALTGIVDKKPALQALPIGGVVKLIKQDLNLLSGNATAFEDALIAAAPDDLKEEANDIKTRIDAAFATAIAAYA